MRKSLKLLLSLMDGNKLLYLSAILFLGFATIFGLLNPLVIRTTIDSIIGDKPLNVFPWMQAFIEMLGGRSVLVQNLWICALILIFLAIGNGLFFFLKGKWSAMASESIAKRIREKLYAHLHKLPYDYHVKAEIGDIIQRCTSDVDTLRRFLATHFINVGETVFKVALVLPIMFTLNVKMTFISMAMTPFLFFFGFIFFTKVKKAFQLADETEGALSTVLQENLSGVRVVRAFARQQFEIEKFDTENQKFRNLNYRVILLMAWYWSISDLLSLFQIGIALIMGAYWAAQGVITLGTYVAFVAYVGMLLWPIRQLGHIIADMGKTFVALDRIRAILEESTEDYRLFAKRPLITGNLEFKNVTFGYEAEQPVIKDISFTVKSGQTVAILGPTGSGKSSLMHLLAGLYDYHEGSVKIDGHELKAINKTWLRRHVGIVLQEPFLYSRTIRNNIAMACENATDKRIVEVAQIASLHDVVQNFEMGYETAVGEKGVTLSGGQKQRLAISRTLIRECPILIFDDSLSAVDTETDAEIRRALKSNGYQATTFIISHRLVTLSEADLILVIEQGELIQSGTHAELIAQPGLYQRIWSIQNSLEAELSQERSAA